MIKNSLTVLFLLAVMQLMAQPKIKKDPVKLISELDGYCMNAQWAPTGDAIAYTGQKYQGITVVDAKGANGKVITKDANVGFGYLWSADGKTILARPMVEEQGVRFRQIASYAVETGAKTVLADRSDNVKSLPVWANGDTQVMFYSDNGKRTVSSAKMGLKSVVTQKTSEFIDCIFKGEAGECLPGDQFKGRYIFNQALSPNKSKIAFQVNGLGLYVANVDGSGLLSLGSGEQAVWMPDGDYLLVAVTKDDGAMVTKGSIEAIDVQTGEHYSLLSHEDIIALNPAISPNGKSLLVDNARDGAIYLVEL